MRRFKRQRRKEQVYDIYSKDVFAKNFRKYFRKSGMTVGKFLKMSGVGKSAFYNWINGKNIPYMRNIETICRVFKINVKDLMGEEIKKLVNTNIVIYDDTTANVIKQYSYPDSTVTLKITAGGYRGNSHILNGMRELNDLKYCPNCGEKIEYFDSCASKENDKISCEIEKIKRDVEDLKKDLDNVLLGDRDLLTESYIENKRKTYKDLKANRRWIKDQLDNCSFDLYDDDVDINLSALRRIDKKISEIENSKIFKYIKEDENDQ